MNVLALLSKKHFYLFALHIHVKTLSLPETIPGHILLFPSFAQSAQHFLSTASDCDLMKYLYDYGHFFVVGRCELPGLAKQTDEYERSIIYRIARSVRASESDARMQ